MSRYSGRDLAFALLGVAGIGSYWQPKWPSAAPGLDRGGKIATSLAGRVQSVTMLELHPVAGLPLTVSARGEGLVLVRISQARMCRAWLGVPVARLAEGRSPRIPSWRR